MLLAYVFTIFELIISLKSSKNHRVNKILDHYFFDECFIMLRCFKTASVEMDPFFSECHTGAGVTSARSTTSLTASISRVSLIHLILHQLTQMTWEQRKWMKSSSFIHQAKCNTSTVQHLHNAMNNNETYVGRQMMMRIKRYASECIKESNQRKNFRCNRFESTSTIYKERNANWSQEKKNLIKRQFWTINITANTNKMINTEEKFLKRSTNEIIAII